MREIKFRLRLGNRIVGYEKWYSGQLAHSHWSASPCWLYSYDNDKWTPNYIWHDEKDQYASLKDKNDQEIYEGDILKNEGGTKTRLSDSVVMPSPHWELSEVVFDNASFMRIIRKQHNSYFGELPSGPRKIFEPENYCEVIGNIYENPELTESGKLGES